MEFTERQNRLARVANSMSMLIEAAGRLIPYTPGQASHITVEEAVILHGEEDARESMLWRSGYIGGPKVELSGFHLTIGDHSYRVYIEEMDV